MRLRGHKQDDYSILPDFLREMRQSAQLTQRALGNILNKPQSFVDACERCLRRVDLPEFVRWCQACDFPVGKAADKFAESLPLPEKQVEPANAILKNGAKPAKRKTVKK